jgi:hypothetical protein
MANETLLSTAKRILELLDLDVRKGGMISRETEVAMLSLRKMIARSPEHLALRDIQLNSIDLLAIRRANEVLNGD